MQAKAVTLKSFEMQAPCYDVSRFSKDARGCYPHVLEALSSRKPDNLLDVGCGTGAVLSLLAQQGSDAELHGLDLSPSMLRQAGAKLEGRAELMLGDAEDLPYENECFDAVSCVESFHHYPDPQLALREMFRVLRPGGLLVLCDCWLPAPMRSLVNLLLPFSGSGDVRIYSPQELTGLLEKAGFALLRCETVTNRTCLYVCDRP